MAKNTICTNCDKAKKITDSAKLQTPPPLYLKTATISIPYLILYLTQLTTYPTPVYHRYQQFYHLPQALSFRI